MPGHPSRCGCDSHPFILSQREAWKPSSSGPASANSPANKRSKSFCRFTPTHWGHFPARYHFLRATRPSTTRFDAGVRRIGIFLDQLGLQPSLPNPVDRQGSSSSQPTDHFRPPSLHRTGNTPTARSDPQGGASCSLLKAFPLAWEEMLGDLPGSKRMALGQRSPYDFRKFYKRPGHQPQVDWVRYHVQCLTIMVIGPLWGGDVRNESGVRSVNP